MKEKTVLPDAMLAEELFNLMQDVNTMEVDKYFHEFSYMELTGYSKHKAEDNQHERFSITLDDGVFVVFAYSEENSRWEMSILNEEGSANRVIFGVPGWAGISVDDVFPEVIGILDENLDTERDE